MDTIVGISLDLQLTDEFSPCRLISEVNMPSVSSLQTDFSFQPNPVHEVFTLSNGRGIPIREIQVFDALGRLLNTISASTTLGERILMNVASLPPGIYYVNVLWKDGYNASRHLIKL
jgi:hypothetical protein